jgi:hypothetical protein
MSRRMFGAPRFAQELRDRLLDEAMERYLDWRAECESVDDAYGNWATTEGALSFAAYRAALDREERAATVYGKVIVRLERVFGGEREIPAAELGAARR